MKRIITVLMAIFCTMTLMAQNEHLKFYGLPLDGTIDSYQTKLEQKGVKYDAAMSKYMPSKRRVYTGDYAGHRAMIYIYFDATTKVVYRAKVIYSGLSEDAAAALYKEVKQWLAKEYEGSDIYDSTSSIGKESVELVPTDNNGDNVGVIDLYQDIAKDKPGVKNYLLHIDFVDTLNYNGDW